MFMGVFNMHCCFCEILQLVVSTCPPPAFEKPLVRMQEGQTDRGTEGVPLQHLSHPDDLVLGNDGQCEEAAHNVGQVLQ